MVRFKVRWILFELVQDPLIENGKVIFPRTPAKLCDDDLNQCIHSALTIDYGDFGNGMARSVYVKWFNPATHIGIARVPRDYTDMMLASLFFIKKVRDQPYSFRTLHVSGTIIGVQKQAIIRDRDIYLQLQKEAQKTGQAFSFVENLAKSEKEIKAIQAFA
ncbi:hypothetical protein BDB00DRAFT_840515 [Zychaea mexicana]|uniref:uncharacterized protein n=1 Tax=Zychaea mexicana TaxID=64656 RepID=UPI0022FE68B3|nr:uncharacterized protein BDB00DRAFT_840515 [Zychaea mexicana]KAI9489895.1 hypothetical protein BDB00DRAFT_840515 [Zychaea mexicana]